MDKTNFAMIWLWYRWLEIDRDHVDWSIKFYRRGHRDFRALAWFEIALMAYGVEQYLLGDNTFLSLVVIFLNLALAIFCAVFSRFNRNCWLTAVKRRSRLDEL